MNAVLKNHLAKEAGIVLAFVSGFGSVALALFAKYHPNDLFDVLVSREVQEDGGRKLLAFMQFVSLFGIPYVALAMTIIVAGLFFLFSYRREALFVLFTPLAGGINVLLKVLVDRPRPSTALVNVYQQLLDPSFPSGHVVYYTVFFGFLIAVMFSLPKIPPLIRIAVVTICFALIALVSLSRVYLGVHWTTDVLGGYCVGYVLLFILAHFYFEQTRRAVLA